jgi:hypothetical protein
MIKNLIKQFEYDRVGSALIMTIVLTVMLSIVAVMFVAVARMDRAATSNIADNKMLESAAKSIIEIIGKELVLDTPGAATPSQEYYDYADVNNAWLASLDPCKSGSDYYWRQISDVNNYLRINTVDCNDVPVGSAGSDVIKDYPVLTPGGLADADGDGIADSKWIELGNLCTSKGRRIYAAVRVIDNGGMININTAHLFDVNSPDANKIDGSSQMQINLKGILEPNDSIITLHNARCGSASQSWNNYEKNVIWDFNVPNGNYLPFDISDELELRYRYCIDSRFESRFEERLQDTTDAFGEPGSLYDGDTNWKPLNWGSRITNPNVYKADHRHVLTTYNLDRVIDPCGNKMTNINNISDPNILRGRIRQAILEANPAYPNADAVAVQIAVNIKDYRDNDSNVTTIKVNSVDYYGFEQPCIYISELACRQVTDLNAVAHKSYAVELYKPYSGDSEPNGWKLINDNMPATPYDINWSGTKQFYVIKWENSNAPLSVNNSDANVLTILNPASNPIFDFGNTIYLTRRVGGNNILVDTIPVPAGWPSAPIFDGNYSVQRDITPHKCIRRLWDPAVKTSTKLGLVNDYNNGDSIYIQAHPKNSDFNNVGQIGMVFRREAYEEKVKIGPSDIEADVFVNLRDPNYQKIFKYLTVIDHPTDANEKRVKGRININTAPWYVIAQLPWVSLRQGGYDNNSLAKAIVAYRDKTTVGGSPDYKNRSDPCGFGSIGELCDVNLGSNSNYRIDYYSRGDGDQKVYPDLDPNDGAVDDFEERDLIFARISDLVTVRSDVFTAYILVRIGTDGPQKRYMAILDRTGVTGPGDKVSVEAFQNVPAAR